MWKGNGAKKYPIICLERAPSEKVGERPFVDLRRQNSVCRLKKCVFEFDETVLKCIPLVSGARREIRLGSQDGPKTIIGCAISNSREKTVSGTTLDFRASKAVKLSNKKNCRTEMMLAESSGLKYRGGVSLNGHTSECT